MAASRRMLNSLLTQRKVSYVRFYHRPRTLTEQYVYRPHIFNTHQCSTRFGRCSFTRRYPNTGRNYCTVPSATGFDDYETEKKNFKLVAPEYFNFSNDVIEKWSDAEVSTGRKNPAFWWVDEEGNELKWGFSELHENSKRAANVLTEACGLQRGDRVLVILPRIPQWWLLNLACIRNGLVLIPGTTLLRSKDIKLRLLSSGATGVITDENVAPFVEQVLADCPSVKSKMLVSEKSVERPGWVNFEKAYGTASADHKCVETRSNEPMTIFFTSGTTGEPKMAEHTHASYGLGHMITGRFWLDLTENDIMFNLSDTGWAKSAYSSLFAPWIQGACVFILNSAKFDPVQTLQVLQKYPITVFCAAPTVYRFLVLTDLSKFKFHSIRHFLSAGEPLNPEVTEEFVDATGHLIREGYGQTETTLLVGTFRCLKNKAGSMGRPAPGYDVRVIDENANEVDDDVEGDVAVRVKPERPVGLFTSYVDDEARTKRSYRGDFYLTGDRAKRDKDGYFWFVARSDDIISSAGYRIGPFEVESALIEHPAVAESAVVSSPDSQRGEVVKAFILLTDAYKNADEESLKLELQEFVKSHTAPYKYPRKIEFVESLPKTVSGKIRRVELRSREWGTGVEPDAE